MMYLLKTVYVMLNCERRNFKLIGELGTTLALKTNRDGSINIRESKNEVNLDLNYFEQ